MKSKKKEISDNKSRGLFDHIKHIRSEKTTDYYSSLTETEKKSFNHYMICRVLSMDKSIIEEIAYISKYFDKIDSANFYKLCCEIVPFSKSFFPYIKNKNATYNVDLLNLIAKKFETSTFDSKDYISVLLMTKKGKSELNDLCRGYGHTEKEIKKLLEIDE